MTTAVHTVTGILLVIGHSIFLFRGLAMRRNGSGPARLDKIARFISHYGIPAALFTGFIAMRSGGPAHPLHIISGILPIITIIAFTPFLSFRRRIPWLLPALNLVFLVSTALIGLLLKS